MASNVQQSGFHEFSLQRGRLTIRCYWTPGPAPVPKDLAQPTAHPASPTVRANEGTQPPTSRCPCSHERRVSRAGDRSAPLLDRGRVGLNAGRLGKDEAAEHVIRRLILVSEQARRWRCSRRLHCEEGGRPALSLAAGDLGATRGSPALRLCVRGLCACGSGVVLTGLRCTTLERRRAEQ